MLCDHCGEKEAVIHLTQIVDNQMGTFHLCETCAADKGLEPEAASANFPLTDFLAQLSQGERALQPADTPCEYCGMTLKDFKKIGRLGCPHCYVTFEGHLRGLLRRLHGGTQHVGKVYLPPDPSEAERGERLSRLKRKLERAVASEDFERAALLRDQIRELEMTRP
ncbi:MAG TPA: UvrB/UvrC motif-containing protein [Longimicrobiales bacterium]|nr:UvrB/UvrC motif-containing protein [Longimicrobiales bacterium]